mmetsp:Transcript_22660/g.70258  ORF Transcript_22660/g.70258 Transcript_22660/m.70258 type:complete len:205 (-) Transcript_22660:499-1113(-)
MSESAKSSGSLESVALKAASSDSTQSCIRYANSPVARGSAGAGMPSPGRCPNSAAGSCAAHAASYGRVTAARVVYDTQKAPGRSRSRAHRSPHADSEKTNTCVRCIPSETAASTMSPSVSDDAAAASITTFPRAVSRSQRTASAAAAAVTSFVTHGDTSTLPPFSRCCRRKPLSRLCPYASSTHTADASRHPNSCATAAIPAPP